MNRTVLMLILVNMAQASSVEAGSAPDNFVPHLIFLLLNCLHPKTCIVDRPPDFRKDTRTVGDLHLGSMLPPLPSDTYPDRIKRKGNHNYPAYIEPGYPT
jgi:hypothetical protein